MVQTALSQQASTTSPRRIEKILSFPGRLVRSLGPGLITGAADDDPSGIATYAQIGAQFGFTMLWTLVLSYPLMAAIQEASAWIGRVSGVGLARNIRLHYPPWLSYTAVFVLLFANVINLAADIAAMADALRLLIGGSVLFYTVVFGGICVSGVVFVSYARFAKILKYGTLVLLLYIATAFVVDAPVQKIFVHSLIPSIRLAGENTAALMAILGTTISPYLFFWQASQEVEEQKSTPGQKPLKLAPHQATRQLKPMRADTYFGMAVSNIIAYFIMLDTGALLHAHGITQITTASQAAEALRPIGGDYAFVFFAVGIIGTGLLAVPVLAGSVGYALAEIANWPYGLAKKLASARAFYGSIAAVTLLGLLLNLSRISPIEALFWSAVINGVCAGPIMVLVMLMTTKNKITGGLIFPRPQFILGWISTGVMLTVAACMLTSFVLQYSKLDFIHLRGL
ncbi:MAG: divalent metal cation transporter [Deltaproteobacteria bacterium]|nr:divalent metal cation transporter [Deltaproteobacteria bacterium]